MLWSRRNFCLALGLGVGGGASWWGLQSSGDADTASPAALPEGRPLLSSSRTSRALGSEVSITVLHASRAAGEGALDAAFKAIDEVEEVMSLYRPSSEICRLNRDGVLRDPHPMWSQVLGLAERLAKESDAKFDVTVQPLWKLYAESEKQGRAPQPEEIEAACRLVDAKQLHVSPKEIRLGRPGMGVTLNGIAQGFAADRCLAALRSSGVHHAMVNTGEIGSLGGKADGAPWRAGIQHPREADAYIALADLDGRCLATSGDYATTFGVTTFGGRRSDHHLFDPKTGRSAGEFSSVSIVAPSGLLADGLSTAVFVLGATRGLELVRSMPNCDALCVLADGRILRTAGFPLVRDGEMAS